MTTVIHKIRLDITNSEQTFKLPKNARILCIHEQNNVPCVWYSFDADEPKPLRGITFYLMATGDSVELPVTAQYAGTAFLCQASYILHIYYSRQ